MQFQKLGFSSTSNWGKLLWFSFSSLFSHVIDLEYSAIKSTARCILAKRSYMPYFPLFAVVALEFQSKSTIEMMVTQTFLPTKFNVIAMLLRSKVIHIRPIFFSYSIWRDIKKRRIKWFYRIVFFYSINLHDGCDLRHELVYTFTSNYERHTRKREWEKSMCVDCNEMMLWVLLYFSFMALFFYIHLYRWQFDMG